MPELLADWFPPEFADNILRKHPTPIMPATGERAPWKGIRLHGAQRGLVLDPYRWKKADGGIRFGKSFGPAVAIYLDFMWRFGKKGIGTDLWGVVADSYDMAHEEMKHLHRLLDEAEIPHRFHTPHAQSWAITFPGHPDWQMEISTKTAADVSKIASRPYRGMVVAEANQTTEDTWDQAVLRVSETRGWAMMTGTFERSKGPWYAQMTKRWNMPGAMGKVYVCPSWDNPLVYPGGREDPEILERERTMAPALFMEKYGGEPQNPSDVVFPEARYDVHVKRRFPHLGTSYDPEQPVLLFSDPGIAHAYSVLAVQVGWTEEGRALAATPNTEQHRLREYGPVVGGGNVLWVIDSIYRWGRDVDQIVEEVLARPWAENVQEAVMDFAAKQRRAEGAPIVEQWAKLWRNKTGRPLWIHANPVPLAAGYDVHRRMLLNGWPEHEAQRTFNHDGKLKEIVDPAGAQVYFDPDAAPPFFGGIVDQQEWAGEYALHRNHRNRQGIVDRAEPIPVNDDAIKALNYGAYWYFGAARTRHRLLGVQSVPWEMRVG